MSPKTTDFKMGVKQRLWWPLYDRAEYAAAGQTVLPFFATPRGQNNKTYADTNMWTGAVLPTGKAHKTHAVRIFIGLELALIADAKLMFKDCFMLLKLNDELMFAERAELFAAGGGIWAMTGVTTAGEFVVSNGLPAAKHIQSLADEPLEWDNEDNIEVTLNWPAAEPISAACKMVVYLDGYLLRNKIKGA